MSPFPHFQHRSNVARPRRTPRRHGCSLSHVRTCMSRKRCSLAGATMPSCSRHSTQTTYTHPQQAVVQNWCSDADRKFRDQAPEQSRNKAPAQTEALASLAHFANGECRAEFAMGWALLPRDKPTRQRQGESRRAASATTEQQTPDEARGVRSPRRSRAFTHAPVHRRQTDAGKTRHPSVLR